MEVRAIPAAERETTCCDVLGCNRFAIARFVVHPRDSFKYVCPTHLVDLRKGLMDALDTVAQGPEIVCPYCGLHNDPGSTRCRECVTEFT